ncbi:sensor histidine kinase [Paenibacillus sp. PK3_47]|uniref:sensor histidine kinase n=1 Tax=Paenibacillus sp. PK3_47 TaxID=2072642 RepID=UPI00201D8754|nr:sensor histidine kinase [Paenibacillus sp. PK3_47]UQZ33044.1 sensor histidine kinase [Paenibacillus sp. PK3_47]
MKLFIREHLLLIAVQIIQFGAMLSIYWLDGYRHLSTALYSVFIGFFFLGCYLVYQFVSRRRYYLRLSRPLETLDEAYQRIGNAPVSKALEELLHTHYRHSMQQLTAVTKQQEQHLTFIDQWVHQMKTPLSVIELTVQNIDEPEFASIREELERMRSGLHTVLYMARLRAFEKDFNIKQVVLPQLIHEVIHDHKRQLIRNRIFPEVQAMNPSISVQSDEKWLFFMLSQIMNNAVKYSAGKASGDKKIWIACYLHDNTAVVEVRDQGIGIQASDLKRVFDPFFTGENGRGLRESTGMGLYLTKEAADRLGHRIELESAAGEGTAVRLIFAANA